MKIGGVIVCILLLAGAMIYWLLAYKPLMPNSVKTLDDVYLVDGKQGGVIRTNSDFDSIIKGDSFSEAREKLNPYIGEKLIVVALNYKPSALKKIGGGVYVVEMKPAEKGFYYAVYNKDSNTRPVKINYK